LKTFQSYFFILLTLLLIQFFCFYFSVDDITLDLNAEDIEATVEACTVLVSDHIYVQDTDEAWNPNDLGAEMKILNGTGLHMIAGGVATEFEIEKLEFSAIIETNVEEFLNPVPMPGRSLLKTSQSRKYPLHMQPTKAVGSSFACPNCQKSYSQLKNMRRHVKLECGQEPQFPCPVCQARFKRNNQLQQHIAKRHKKYL
jgi:uncharacterized C2H2 Zn-finger protein